MAYTLGTESNGSYEEKEMEMRRRDEKQKAPEAEKRKRLHPSLCILTSQQSQLGTEDLEDVWQTVGLQSILHLKQL